MCSLDLGYYGISDISQRGLVGDRIFTIYWALFVCLAGTKSEFQTKQPTQNTQLLLLRWCQTTSLWNWATTGPIVQPPDDMCLNMIRTGRNGKTRRKTLLSATSSTINLK